MRNKRILTLIFVVAFLTLLAGCFPPPIEENQAPIITSDPVKTATVGVVYTYDVDATDPDGDTLTYSLTTYPSGMTIDSVTGVIGWDPQILDQVGDNSVVVKVSDGALSVVQSFTIKVSKPTPVKLTKIVVLPETMDLFVGETETIASVTAHYSDGSTKDISLGDCIYVSSNTKVVPLFDDGNLTAGQSPGKATITVTYILDEIIFTDTVEVTVVAVPPVLLTSIKVSPDTITLSLGATLQLKVTALYDDGNHGDVTSDCIFVSSNTKVVPLHDDGNGIILGQSPVKATITVTYTSNSKNKVFTDTVEVTVKAVDEEVTV